MRSFLCKNGFCDLVFAAVPLTSRIIVCNGWWTLLAHHFLHWFDQLTSTSLVSMTIFWLQLDLAAQKFRLVDSLGILSHLKFLIEWMLWKTALQWNVDFQFQMRQSFLPLTLNSLMRPLEMLWRSIFLTLTQREARALMDLNDYH